ncbi:FAD-dependent monooxygenase [Nocardiopsis sp. CNT-189]|uniref:FAD-dependent oxidoreductase n=1 Tax=Nocardiopsis oceanisediminis TaxID=2816862 RepID=UPI003B36845A
MTETSTPDHTSVLIVGGGLAGLSMALFLARRGIDSVLVERHAGTSTHPRARGVNVRTMEILRAAGLEEEVRATESARALAGNHGIIAARSLAGEEFGRMEGAHTADPRPDAWRDVSPTHWALCDQDELEPLLAERARAHGARLLFGHELTDLKEEAATVRDLSSGASFRIDADHVVAADGAGSPLRRRLSVPMEGPGALANFANVYFHADLSGALGDRRFVMCYVKQEGLQGALLPIDNVRRWLLHVPIGPDWEAERHRFDPDGCTAMVRAATGLPSLDVDVRGVLPWESAGRVAASWREGRVFFIGDAAHVMPPTGAFGSNTGIQDAYDLAWKLAAVLRGEAGERLLDSYEAERRPVAEATVEQAVLRSRDRAGGKGGGASSPIAPDADVMLGYRYASEAVAAEEGAPEGVFLSDARGLPGTRAPHVGLPGGGSLLDRYGEEFALVALDPAWRRAAASAAAGGARLRSVRVPEEAAADFRSRYGVGPRGAVLVRPDGFVGWRSAAAPAAPAEALAAALGRLTLGGGRR